MPADSAASACPSEEVLASFIDGALEPQAVAALEHHLAGCHRCCCVVASVPDVDDAPAVDVTQGPDDDLPPSDIVAQPHLGRYVLLERLGAGGMGVVWAAYDPELDRRVAIKVLHHDASGSAGTVTRERLLHEARAMARVSHPNIVAVHDVVEVSERVLLVMELVPGRTMAAWLGERTRGWREIVEHFVAAGRGLAAAHAQGVVHRDFKPANILVGDDGRVRVGDFGLATTGRPVAEQSPSVDGVDTGLVQTSGFIGTPAYMAPEQYAGEGVDPRTDQFAFCVALWEALFGVRPFSGSTVTMLAASIVEGRIAPRDRTHRVPARIERALRRGLERERSARHPDMLALLASLERATSRRSTRALAFGLLGVAVLSLALPWRRDDPCGAAPEWLDAAWGPSSRAQILAAGSAQGPAASDLAERLADALDARVARITATFGTSCRAAFVDHSERAEDHDARLACLQRDAAAIETIAEFARDADQAGLARALRATSGVSSPRCDRIEDARADAPWMSEPVDRERATELGLAVRRAAASRRLGDYAIARQQLEAPLAAADDFGLGSIVAAALYEQALLDLRDGRDTAGLNAALSRAIEVGDDRLAFDALNQLVVEEGARRNDLRAAEVHAELAMAFATRSGHGDDGRGMLRLSLGQARERAGDLRGAREVLLEARGFFDAAGTTDSAEHLALWLWLGLVEEQTGELAAAEAWYEKARAIAESAWGPFHPDVAVSLEYLATVRRKAGAFDRALEAAERSLAIRRAVLGDAHPETAVSLGTIGNIRLEEERWPEAEAAIGAALEIWTALPGRERNAGMASAALGEVSLRRGDHRAARLHYEKAVAFTERALGTGHPELAFALLGMGLCDRAAGSPDASLVWLERAWGLVGSHDADPIMRGEVALELARSLAETGASARARELVAQARADAAGATEHAYSSKLLAELDELSSRLEPER
jgi:serine/threonine protein kinase